MERHQLGWALAILLAPIVVQLWKIGPGAFIRWATNRLLPDGKLKKTLLS